MQLPTEEEFNAWLRDPTTQMIRGLLGKKRDELRRLWEAGSFTDYAKDGTVLVNVGNMGTCKGLAFVEELTYEQLKGEIDDE